MLVLVEQFSRNLPIYVFLCTWKSWKRKRNCWEKTYIVPHSLDWRSFGILRLSVSSCEIHLPNRSQKIERKGGRQRKVSIAKQKKEWLIFASQTKNNNTMAPFRYGHRFFGEIQRIAFRLMLSSCVSVCVCVYTAFVDHRKTVWDRDAVFFNGVE